MGIISWEPDVEYYEIDEAPNPIVVAQPYIELPFSQLAIQDSIVRYSSTERRSVSMRVLGFSATNPIVQAVISLSGGSEKVRKGELVGCRHPDDLDIVQGVLRTYHVPVLREIGRTSGVGLLPMPTKKLRVTLPSRKLR